MQLLSGETFRRQDRVVEGQRRTDLIVILQVDLFELGSSAISLVRISTVVLDVED